MPETLRASLAQDLWIGTAPRFLARRYAPWREAPVRLAFQLDPGRGLGEPAIASFLEALGRRVDVVALEPRAGAAEADLAAHFRTLAELRWRDGLPLVVGGHGTGALLAAAVADLPHVRGVVALAPAQPVAVARPLLIVAAGDDVGPYPQPSSALTVLARVQDAHTAVLEAPWPDIVAAWAAAVGRER